MGKTFKETYFKLCVQRKPGVADVHKYCLATSDNFRKCYFAGVNSMREAAKADKEDKSYTYLVIKVESIKCFDISGTLLSESLINTTMCTIQNFRGVPVVHYFDTVS